MTHCFSSECIGLLLHWSVWVLPSIHLSATPTNLLPAAGQLTRICYSLLVIAQLPTKTSLNPCSVPQSKHSESDSALHARLNENFSTTNCDNCVCVFARVCLQTGFYVKLA